MTPWTAAASKLARQLTVAEGDSSAMHMIECGLHSGFPSCCVAFFVKVWWPYTLAIGALSTRARADASVAYDAYQEWTARPGYVPCPRCVIDRSFVRVRSCDCESKRLERRSSSRGNRTNRRRA